MLSSKNRSFKGFQSTQTMDGNVAVLPPVCSFESFSSHFDLPLKNAAEKFGVRATAFKKRCRTIGIRHWPYRKVRSLKRSICELQKCEDSGSMSEKQRQQFMSYIRQLNKIMSPQTYGIESSDSLVNFEEHESPISSPEQIHYRNEKNEEYRKNITMIDPRAKLAAPFLTDIFKTPEDLHAAKEFASEMFSNSTQETIRTTDEFGDSFQYTGERHFLDDYIFEMPTIYDCKV